MNHNAKLNGAGDYTIPNIRLDLRPEGLPRSLAIFLTL